MHDVVQYSVLAAGTAGLYALLAQGILIVHRGSRILNFAQGTYVMFAAFFFHAVRLHGWPQGVAAVATILVLGIIGASTYLLAVRPLRDASLVSRIVATLGIVIVLTELTNLLWPVGGLVEPVLSTRLVKVFGTPVGLDRLLLLGISIVVAVGLWALYKFTTLGIATAAVSENRRAAAALGWSADRIALVSWALSGIVAGLAGVLAAPIAASLEPTVLTLNVVPALAVALIARFRSFPIAAVAAVALASVQGYVGGSFVGRHPVFHGVEATIPFIAIIIALALQGDRLPARGERSERRPALGRGTTHPRAVLLAVAITVTGLWTVLPKDWVDAVSRQAAFVLLLLSLVVVLGYAGQLSLGQMAFGGIAALVAGRLVATQHWSFELAMVVGIVSAAAAGAVFALPALRTRGVALGIVTLGLGAAVYQLLFLRTYYSPKLLGARNLSFGASPEGTIVEHLTLFGIHVDQLNHPKAYATMCVLMTAIVSIAVLTMRRGRAGRRLIATRTNERAAASLGVNVAASKLYAFTLSASVAGMFGILFSFRNHVIAYNTDYNPLQSIYAVAFSVVGGIGSVLGAVFGAFLLPGTAGAAIGRDFSDWLVNLGHPRPWITALLVVPIIAPISKRIVARLSWPRWGGLVILGVGGVVGAVLAKAIGWLFATTNEHVTLLPWFGALIIGYVGIELVKFAKRHWTVPKWSGLIAFVVLTVFARLVLHHTTTQWVRNLPRYLPLLGGVGLIVMMVQHGDGLAETFARAARSFATRPSVPALAGVDAQLIGSQVSGPGARMQGATLEIRGMSVSFGGVLAVNNFDFAMRPGEVVGLIGPNGAGKSTVVDAITGYAPLKAGEILIDGESITRLSAHLRSRIGIARTFQNLELFDDLTVLENLAAASDTHDMKAYLTNLVYSGKPRLSPMANDAVAAFSLQGEISRRADSLAHGRRRLVAVARAVATNPKVLLLDEPAAGLDEVERRELAQVIRNVATTYGIGVMVIEHDMDFIMSLCDHIVVIDFGKKIAEGLPHEVQSDRAVVAAYLGEPMHDEEEAAETLVSDSAGDLSGRHQ